MPAEPQFHQSMLSWWLQSIGLGWGLFIVAVAGLVFVLTVLVVARGQGPFSASALVLLITAPLVLTFFSALMGTIQSFAVIAASDISVKPSELAGGISATLVRLAFGMLLTAPSLAWAALGSVFRALTQPVNQKP